MSIRVIVEAALEAGCLSTDQERQINGLLMQGSCTTDDLQALDRLSTALTSGTVKTGEASVLAA